MVSPQTDPPPHPAGHGLAQVALIADPANQPTARSYGPHSGPYGPATLGSAVRTSDLPGTSVAAVMIKAEFMGQPAPGAWYNLLTKIDGIFDSPTPMSAQRSARATPGRTASSGSCVYSQDVVAREMRMSYALALFKDARVTLAKAAEPAGMNIYEFIAVCKAQRIPVIDISRDELVQEMQSIGRPQNGGDDPVSTVGRGPAADR